MTSLWAWRFTRRTFQYLDVLFERNPRLRERFNRFRENYLNRCEYRQYGLNRDDLINEDCELVKTALSRLPDKVIFDRSFRIRRAVFVSSNHEKLPPEEWTKPEEDKSYLFPVVMEVVAEQDHLELMDQKNGTETGMTRAQLMGANGTLRKPAK
ncbi:14 kDa subunit of cytochrome bd ubiquinol oxidase [Rozella allomycis CSF55]|uniref:Complex III subunit 7 n=1 Tax=Rozella allomycis (strain CSF55) TaxID=988480 RepID=A0A075ARR4_ROZAC|nr:Cytochrome b-c1 complex subunit 7 domain-containing protein [Rozella allomycis CSF55]RKP19207.1 14 kDa subunit of cytochrome bd ubiquinol oxidase [Rozella allomycis CSF55]|eukprot:EPZ31411.1 Cytochrome b-c1 complex subunit 7 domain-containing protein [Rozella allomycis CSF55]